MHGTLPLCTTSDALLVIFETVRTSVFELFVIDSNLDGDRGIDETNERGGHSDEVGAASVGSAGVATDVADQPTTDHCECASLSTDASGCGARMKAHQGRVLCE